MNYIKQLQAENEELRANLKKTQDLLLEVACYLQSDKFHVDTTVQVQDVQNRLDPVWDATYGS
jgi:predicted transcriptional regulator